MNKYLISIAFSMALVVACGIKAPALHNTLALSIPATQASCPSSSPDFDGNYGQMIYAGQDMNDNGLLDPSERGNSYKLCNGAQGITGTSGTPGQDAPQSIYMPVAVIQPCGSVSSTYKEVLLGLAGGDLLSEFTGGSSTDQVRNTLIPDGSYYNTDSSQCNFTISTLSNSNRLVTWDGSTHNGSGPYSSGSATYTALTQSWAIVQN